MKNLILIGFLLLSLGTTAQEKDNFLVDGNANFAEKNYVDAEANYRISQSKTPKNAKAAYNLGTTIYTIDQPSEAGQSFIKAAQLSTSRAEKHKAYHNLGNVFMKEKNYAAAVSAYRDALINDPSDDETRYNFALAKKFLKENPPPPEKKKEEKKEDKKDKEDKKEDQKPDDKKEKDDKKGEEKDNKEKDGDKDKKEGNDNQPKSEPQEGQGIPKQRIENLLDAVNNEEKKIQDKVKARQIKGKPVNTDKDW